MNQRFTFDQLAAAAERELRLRRRVYAHRVEIRKMSQAKADEEIALMSEIAAHLRENAKRDSLFGGTGR